MGALLPKFGESSTGFTHGGFFGEVMHYYERASLRALLILDAVASVGSVPPPPHQRGDDNTAQTLVLEAGRWTGCEVDRAVVRKIVVQCLGARVFKDSALRMLCARTPGVRYEEEKQPAGAGAASAEEAGEEVLRALACVCQHLRVAARG